MILITGGLGFIGSHTARALLDRGEECVLVQRRDPADARNPLLADELGKRAVVEQVDVADLAALRDVGERHEITGVLHLAGAFFGDPVEDAREGVNGLLNIIDAARGWGSVRRIGIASTLGVYDGDTPNPLREDVPLPLSSRFAIPSGKKVNEILASFLGPATGIEIYSARIGAIWGPLGRVSSRFMANPQLIHAAVAGTKPDFSIPPGTGRTPYAEDGFDMMYVRECGRALALLQTADRLEHRVYNVASGRVTTYREVVDGIRAVIPEAQVELPEGEDPANTLPRLQLDISRLREDTGYQPEFDTARAVADYISWLRAGNER